MPDSRKNKKGPIEEIKSPRSHKLKLERIKPTYKQAEEVFQRSRKEWDKTFNAISDWVVLMDVGGRILRTNIIGEDFTGVPVDEMIGQSCCSLVHGSDKKIPGCPLLKMLETGQRASVELQVPGADCWVMVTVDPVTDEEGKIKGAIHITRDVTKSKETEEMLKESEEHARIFASYQHAISELREFYVREADFEQMLQKTVDLIVRNFGYYMAWFGELKADEKVIIPKVWAGKYEKYLDGLQLELNDSKDAKCAVSIAIVTGKPFGYADLEHDKDFEKWRPLALKYGYCSNQAIPLVINDKSIGAFLVYSTRPRVFSETLIQYLTGIVNELATIVDNITKQKNAEEELRKYHEHLEEMIEERTVELKKVNERLKEDITERKQVEEALRESEEKFRNLAEQSPNQVFINQKGKIVYANKKCEEIMGYSREELYSPEFNYMALIAPESQDLIKQSSSEHMKGKEVAPFEYTLITKEGKRIDAIYASKLIKYEGENALLGTITDITNRKKVEEALKESESRYRSIFNSACDGLCIVDGNGTILEVNPQMCKIYGYSYQELIGTNAEKLVQPDYIHQFEKFKEEMQKTGTFQAESVDTCKDGTPINIEAKGTTFDFKGQKCILAILRDITERKHAERRSKSCTSDIKGLYHSVCQ
ncbi:MAG: PAS domain S-box protein [Planctomycetota bacterium]|jgi:PAS domain S-box-containing protein